MNHTSEQYIELCDVPERFLTALAPYADEGEEITVYCHVDDEGDLCSIELQGATGAIPMYDVDPMTRGPIELEGWLMEQVRERAEMDACDACRAARVAAAEAAQDEADYRYDELRDR